MPGKIEFTEEARADIRAIVAYTIETWSAAQADKYIDGLEALCGEIAAMPGLGKGVPELGRELRCFPYESHILYYRPTASGIMIIAVMHKRQNPRLRLTD